MNSGNKTSDAEGVCSFRQSVSSMAWDTKPQKSLERKYDKANEIQSKSEQFPKSLWSPKENLSDLDQPWGTPLDPYSFFEHLPTSLPMTSEQSGSSDSFSSFQSADTASSIAGSYQFSTPSDTPQSGMSLSSESSSSSSTDMLEVYNFGRFFFSEIPYPSLPAPDASMNDDSNDLYGPWFPLFPNEVNEYGIYNSKSLIAEPAVSETKNITFPTTPKGQNISKKHYCSVDSCKYSTSELPGFYGFSRVERRDHYEAMHPDLVLRCKFAGCKSQGFLRQSDLKGHTTKYHRSSLLKNEKQLESRVDFTDEDSKIAKLECEETMEDKTSREYLDSIPEPCNRSPSQPPAPTNSTTSPDTETPSTCSDGFETDSPWSEDNDWADNFDLQGYESYELFSIDHPEIVAQIVRSPDSILPSALNPVKQRVVDSIMKEFWVIFNQEWSANIRRRSGNSPESTSSPASHRKGSPEKLGDKRRRGKGDDEERNPDENRERDPKRQKTSASPLTENDEGLQFGCPYRKHNPRKYCHLTRKWRSCALTPLKDISRVKGHLYRYHRVFQCKRCKKLFENNNALENHIVEVSGCKVANLTEPVEGILVDGSIEKQLRSRKKAYPGQTDVERWQEIYKILFPMDLVPDAYFEVIPAADDIIRSPDSEELASYEEYSRRELPRFFGAALQEAIRDEAQPMEDRLRSQLVSMIQDCQDRVFSAYRERRRAETPTSSQQTLSSFHTETTETTDTSRQETNPMNRLGGFFQGPPAQIAFQTNSEAVLPMTSTPREPNAHSDSGYASELSASNPDNVKQKTSTENLTENSESQDSVETLERQRGRPDSSPQSIPPEERLGPDIDQILSTDENYIFNFNLDTFQHGSGNDWEQW